MQRRLATAAITLFLLALCAAAPVFSLSITELDVNASLAFIGSNPQPVFTGQDPMLGIAPLLGVSVPLRLSGQFFIEPGLEFLGWYYDWTGSAAQITQAENGSGFFTIGALLSFQAGVTFPLGTAVSLGAAAGLDLFARFPFELQNTGTSVKADEGSALGWFYGGGRFLYPEARLFLRWHVSEPVDVLVNLRGFFPIFHLWDGSGQPFWDALMVTGGVGFAVRLGSTPAAQPASTSPQPSSPEPAK